jgi:hypothetical protein
MEMIKALSIAVVIAGISATSYAKQQWNINATSCVADAGTIRDSLYLGTGGTIKFASGKTGNIILYCPVPRLDFKPALLVLDFLDDVPRKDSRNGVTAQLIKMSMLDGSIRPVITVFSNNAQTPTNQGKASVTGMSFNDSYDPINFAYYIRIDIMRSSATTNEIAYAVGLLDKL